MGATSRWKAPPGWQKLRSQVFARHGRRCWRCGAYAGTVDHVVPVALGGTHELSNLRPACSSCNSSTGASMGNRLQPRTPPWQRGAGSRLPGPRRAAAKAARIPGTPGPWRTSRDW
jgi:5-methylcytosine-specific restriction endonuclease McrA